MAERVGGDLLAWAGAVVCAVAVPHRPATLAALAAGRLGMHGLCDGVVRPGCRDAGTAGRIRSAQPAGDRQRPGSPGAELWSCHPLPCGAAAAVRRLGGSALPAGWGRGTPAAQMVRVRRRAAGGAVCPLPVGTLGPV